MKVVIIGGVAGGASAAARLRRLDERAEIIVFERSGFVSYANCGLPYYIGGTIAEKRELTLQTPESFWNRFRIRVKTKHEVLAIDPAAKTVTVKNLSTGKTFTESYDKLVLSPGAMPTRPPLPGIDSERIFSLRTVEDTLRIHDYVRREKPQSAVLVGGGYIGIEVAENLREKGIRLELGRSVSGFEERDGQILTLIDGQDPLPADLVLLAIGVTPDSGLAKQTGLALGIKGSIVVNDRMETSAPDIYAVGDAVQVKHAVTGQDALIALAGPANKQGRIAADNICGLDSRYRGSQGSSIIKVFDLTVASTGLTEKAAASAGIDADCVVLSPGSHASYYPGARPMTMKVVFEKQTFRLLGAQIAGGEGVDKRIDVLAVALHAGMRADELKGLDLAYAPPYSSAKDPVNMAGFMVENLKRGLVRQWHWDEEPSLARDGSITLLDVRTSAEYERGHIDGFRNIPVDELRERLGELDRDKPLYVICQSGLRSYIACRILAQEGFDCRNFSGGYRFYAAVTKERGMGSCATPCGMDR